LLLIISIFCSENTYRVCAALANHTIGKDESNISAHVHVKLSGLFSALLYNLLGAAGSQLTNNELSNHAQKEGLRVIHRDGLL
jgi:hypothetical protein